MVHGNINHSSGSGIAYCTPFTRGIFGSEVDGQELKSEEEKKGSDIEALDVSFIILCYFYFISFF